MCCCFGGFTCCYGGNCGYCSECVQSAACNPSLCGDCISGDFTTDCCISAGSAVGICANSCICTTCLPYAGSDGNGNDIYELPDGQLVYTDGSPATRGDIACNEGACAGTPCSPLHCGVTEPAPSASRGGGSDSPKGGSSGAGSAKSSGGSAQPLSRSQQSGGTKPQQTLKAQNSLGSVLASLLGKTAAPVAAKKILPGQKVALATTTTVSPNTFLLVIVVIGFLLLMMAFGQGGEA